MVRFTFMETKELLDRTFSFGVNVLTFLHEIKYNEVLSAPKKQLSRAAVAIGANYEESQAAESKKDFIHKIGIVCKEARESHYWLRVLIAVHQDEKIKDGLNVYLKEAYELKSIFSAIKLSAEGKKTKSGSSNMQDTIQETNINH